MARRTSYRLWFLFGLRPQHVIPPFDPRGIPRFVRMVREILARPHPAFAKKKV